MIVSVLVKANKIRKKKLKNPLRLNKDAEKTIRNFLMISN